LTDAPCSSLEASFKATLENEWSCFNKKQKREAENIARVKHYSLKDKDENQLVLAKDVELEEVADEFIPDLRVGGKSEDVRTTNFAYTQTRIAEYLTMYFALVGLGSAIVASELNLFHNEDDINKEHIITLLSISNVSTLFLGVAVSVNQHLILQWLKAKKYAHPKDDLITSGLW